MQQNELNQQAEAFLAAWNSQQVEDVLAWYTPDIQYRDPHVQLQGSEALRPYLGKLFALWDMHWSLREAYWLANDQGAAVLWHATLKRKGRDDEVAVDGMDLVVFNGSKLSRNDVYFDRSVLHGL